MHVSWLITIAVYYSVNILLLDSVIIIIETRYFFFLICLCHYCLPKQYLLVIDNLVKLAKIT